MHKSDILLTQDEVCLIIEEEEYFMRLTKMWEIIDKRYEELK